MDCALNRNDTVPSIYQKNREEKNCVISFRTKLQSTLSTDLHINRCEVIVETTLIRISDTTIIQKKKKKSGKKEEIFEKEKEKRKETRLREKVRGTVGCPLSIAAF